MSILFANLVLGVIIDSFNVVLQTHERYEHVGMSTFDLEDAVGASTRSAVYAFLLYSIFLFLLRLFCDVYRQTYLLANSCGWRCRIMWYVVWTVNVEMV